MPNQPEAKTAKEPYRITAIGEVLWDVFPNGPRFGGAPANFACTLAKLGGPQVLVSMVSCVGDDPLGTQALEALRGHGVNTQHVEISPQETGKVLIELDRDGKASYRFATDTAWDNLGWNEALAELAERADAICYGTLGQRSGKSRETIQRFVRAAAGNETALRVFDINLRPPFVDRQIVLESLELANVLKLNDEELPWLAETCELRGEAVDVMSQLAERFGLGTVALTCGPRGAVVLRDGEVSRQASEAAELVDTVGAGDAYTAALVLGLLNDRALDTINRDACQLAAYVCSQAGATPAIPARFLQSRGDDS